MSSSAVSFRPTRCSTSGAVRSAIALLASTSGVGVPSSVATGVRCEVGMEAPHAQYVCMVCDTQLACVSEYRAHVCDLGGVGFPTYGGHDHLGEGAWTEVDDGY